jgi:perosamine synthetase
MSDTSNELVAALRSVLGHGEFPLHAPLVGAHEVAYTTAAIESTYVSSVGQFVGQFESNLAAICNVKHAVATVNGTAALHLALLVCGVLPGDEVLIPSLTFVATASSVVQAGAIPHFVDSCSDTFGIDPERLSQWLAVNTRIESGVTRNRATGRRISAVVPVHVFGQLSRVQELSELAREYGLHFVEDAAEALGSSHGDRPAGSFGRISAMSFNGNKIVTTGGGGALLTDDEELARHAKHLSTTAKVAHEWEFEHDEFGFNYRMPNINAALGCAQLERLPEFLASKRRLHEEYAAALEGIPGVTLHSETVGTTSNYWLQTVLLDANTSRHRDDILRATNQAGFQTRPAWRLISDMKPYSHFPRQSLENASRLAERIVNLPSGAGLV